VPRCAGRDLTDANTPAQRPNLTLAVLALGGFAYAVLQALVIPAIPAIAHDLHTSLGSASWLLSAPLLAASVFTPIAGRLGDMYGKERVLFASLVVLALGTVWGGLSHSVLELDAARVVQGAAGGIFPLAFGVIRDEFPPERVAGGIGLVSAILGIGAGAGILLAGVILEHLGWQWLFWAPVPVIVLATVLCYLFVPESPVRTPGEINWIAGLLMAIGLSAVLVAISEATTWGWGSSRTVGVMAGGLVCCALWIIWEVRSRTALVDMRMMRIRPVWTTNLAAALLGGGMYAAFIMIPEFVTEPRSTGFGFGASVVGSGLFLLPTTLLMIIMSLQAGRLAHRFGSKPSLVVGTFAASAAFGLLVLAHSRPLDFYVAMGLLGFGNGLSFAALGNLIVEAVPRSQTGVASGMNTVMRTVGGAIGAQIAATFVADHVRKGVPLIGGFTLAFAFLAGLLLVSVIATLAIPGRPPAAELSRITRDLSDDAARGEPVFTETVI
jgi:EmrB/QacA subfamily drug resistance transporter